jgi:uncharacterized protein YjbI with pentapeptide repeats
LATVAVAVVTLANTNQANREQATLARQQASLAERGQITDRFIRAVEQIGTETVDTRVGGVYALERIMRDSRADESTVVEVLAAFVRSHPEPPDTTVAGADALHPAIDVQAALTVLGRRPFPTADGSGRIDLAGAHIAGARLDKAMLRQADLSGADLRGADLRDANLIEANLHGARLDGATLVAANLNEVDLARATLRQADLSFVNDCYQGTCAASLSSADLTGAQLYSAELTGALLDHAALDGSRMGDSTLAGAYLVNADVRGADLSSTLGGRGANLRNAIVIGADFRGANLVGADLRDVRLDLTTQLPPGTDTKAPPGP